MILILRSSHINLIGLLRFYLTFYWCDILSYKLIKEKHIGA